MAYRNYTIENMPEHEYANCKVLKFSDGSVGLRSYSTYICEIDKNGWLSCTGLYSRTTIKHIGWFMRYYGKGFGYYTAKDAYLNGYVINLETGEILSYDEYNKQVAEIA